MQLLILLAVGYITGIIWGLYLKVNIVPIIFLFGLGLILLRKNNLIDKNKSYIVIFIITVFVSNVRINILESKFNNLYKDLNQIEVVRNYYR